MTARYAWGDVFVNGDWVPIDVTINDPAPRRAAIEVVVSNGGSVNALIEAQVMTYATPTTHRIHVPKYFHWRAEPIRVVLRDAASGEAIASSEINQVLTRGWQTDGTGGAVGVVGVGAQVQGMVSRMQASQVNWQHVGDRVPSDMVELDALDVLVLWGVDLARMDAAQERVLVRYVRAGGYVLVWPGERLIDDERPFAQMMPAKIGPPTVMRSDGLSGGWTLVSAQAETLMRPLEPRDGARTGPDLAGVPGAVWKEAGLGRIALIAIDPGALTHADPNVRKEIGAWAMSGFVDTQANQTVRTSGTDAPPTIAAKVRPGVYADGSMEPQEALLARLADFPNVRVIDPRWVLWGMIALGLLVGPVDWLVLRAIGRQPLTWVTTVGWSLVVTGGALLAVSGAAAGASQVRTMTIVDQLNTTTVHRSVHVCMYAARRERVDITSATGWWWRVPNTSGWAGYSEQRARASQFVEFDQTATDTTPRAVGLARRAALVMRADQFEPTNVAIEAKLDIEDGQLVGTIMNKSDGTFDRFEIEIPGVGEHAFEGSLATGAELPVRIKLDAFRTRAESMDSFGETETSGPESKVASRDVFGLHGLAERSHRQSRDAGMVIRAFGRTNDPPARLSMRGDVETQNDLVVRVRLSKEDALDDAE